jgi:hypothetical protein
MQTETTLTPALQEQVRHLDRLLDEALADSFPASDPVSSLAIDDPVPNGTGEPFHHSPRAAMKGNIPE